MSSAFPSRGPHNRARPLRPLPDGPPLLVAATGPRRGRVRRSRPASRPVREASPHCRATECPVAARACRSGTGPARAGGPAWQCGPCLRETRDARRPLLRPAPGSSGRPAARLPDGRDPGPPRRRPGDVRGGTTFAEALPELAARSTAEWSTGFSRSTPAPGRSPHEPYHHGPGRLPIRHNETGPTRPLSAK